MSFFEFRKWLESSVPWWIPFAIPLVGVVILAFQWFAKSIRDMVESDE